MEKSSMCHKKGKRTILGLALSMTLAHACLPVASDTQKLPEDFVFSRDYLEKYFPKVFVTRDFFLCMTVDEVAAALGEVVAILAENPAFYFTNPGQPFKINHYWEHVVDQLSWTSEFLERALVDEKTGKIILKQYDVDIFSSSYACWQSDSKAQELPLAPMLAEHKLGTYYQFYALCFDYLKKLFNEGILLFDVHQTTHYYSELEFVTEKLRGSIYEAEYQEHFKEAYELMSLLKQKLDIKDDMFENSMTRNRARRRMGLG